MKPPRQRLHMVIVSDTHTKHRDIGEVPPCDVLVHCGDATTHGTYEQLRSFAIWAAEQPAKNVIAIAGNHDLLFRDGHEHARWLYERAGIRYLQDSSCEIDGVKFYGSPWTSAYHQTWSAFTLERGCRELAAKWAAIPNDTDVLITHGPPAGICDYTLRSGRGEGCGALRRRVEQLAQERLRLHVFGHIHESRGVEDSLGKPVFINAANWNHHHHYVSEPTEYWLELGRIVTQ